VSTAPSTSTGLTPAEGAILGTLVGGVVGGAALGGGMFATGLIVSEVQCPVSCTDSDALGYLLASPYAAVLGVIVGAVSGGLVGAALADESLPVHEQCGATVVGVCPSSQFCLSRRHATAKPAMTFHEREVCR
jgi:hypothetical protein